VARGDSRGLLQIESAGSEAGDWVLASAEPPEDGQDALEYEQVLLEWVARPGYVTALASLATDLPAGLAEVREGVVLDGQLLPDALHFGLAGPAHPLARFAHAWVAAFAELPEWRAPARWRTDSGFWQGRGRVPVQCPG
jgi:hypothetical protein